MDVYALRRSLVRTGPAPSEWTRRQVRKYRPNTRPLGRIGRIGTRPHINDFDRIGYRT